MADEDGLDLFGVQDHPYAAGLADTMAVIATVLADTERLRVFPDVANLPLREPAVLAKQAATLDLLSGGRFELGLGAGGFWPPSTPWEARGARRARRSGRWGRPSRSSGPCGGRARR
ncbi:LLM class flavin-dependent oxidoreductase [Actinomadura madurae]|uniref:LLM class flavin-dependent oxidoreductase n=1 Tax=Actinomadura madurae TaxID=1993 RepID=UPI0020D231AF|nr:LLM class flavin-dependent oxidoreductase [Actinomadura madurae]MCP9954990.1 LLM class flavin-dependent oxidoreductase [Actinomadura madurae]MCP9971723.1 LLM class flavin-dependent oxidoreductase [Actinomadura madurae]MCQ0004221.1 LLM class flavin-dependent oxidoreductase [Actinomadura madurae]MCQ0020426.1 LLM class flavin-dependent oxidoreductase [Actinomadura madurae]